jgi:hypothetical protein
MTDTNAPTELRKLIDKVGIAMLTTVDPHGRLEARPLDL